MIHYSHNYSSQSKTAQQKERVQLHHVLNASLLRLRSPGTAKTLCLAEKLTPDGSSNLEETQSYLPGCWEGVALKRKSDFPAF